MKVMQLYNEFHIKIIYKLNLTNNQLKMLFMCSIMLSNAHKVQSVNNLSMMRSSVSKLFHIKHQIALKYFPTNHRMATLSRCCLFKFVNFPQAKKTHKTLYRSEADGFRYLLLHLLLLLTHSLEGNTNSPKSSNKQPVKLFWPHTNRVPFHFLHSRRNT